jgi:hypothetical protein
MSYTLAEAAAAPSDFAECLIARLAARLDSAYRQPFRLAAESALATLPPQSLGDGAVYRTVEPIWRRYFIPAAVRRLAGIEICRPREKQPGRRRLLVDVSDRLLERGGRDAQQPVGQAEFEDEEYREGYADGSERKRGNDQFVRLSEHAHAEEQNDRPDHNNDDQAGANWVTDELKVCEDTPVVYLTGERVG